MTDTLLSPFQYAIETPRPLSAEGGRFQLTGWCVCPEKSLAPLVRLTCAGRIFSASSKIRRPDVTTALNLEASAVECGFAIAGKLPPGAHLAALEAGAGDEPWQVVNQFILVAMAGELQASVEWPGSSPIRESVRVQGWCAHPDFTLTEVWLHYGNRRLKCTYGLPRTDVPALLPEAPNAPQAGFIAEKNLPAGYGPLRIRAVTATGETIFANVPVAIDITRDEENPTPLDLHGKLPDLGPARRTTTTTGAAVTSQTERAGHRVLFVLYGDFTSNSALHVSGLSNALIDQGNECVVAVPHQVETIRYHPGARFRAISFEECLKNPAVFSEGRRADIVHAWTTRENVRRFCASVRANSSSQLVIHLEDHELRILEDHTSRSLTQLLALSEEELDALVPSTLSHPRHSQAFLRSADAITVIIDRLREMVPEGKSTHVIWPSAEETRFFSRPIPWAMRRALGWPEEHTVLFYHGNVHATNAAEMRELYAAVLRLNQTGQATTLIRAGKDDGNFLGELAEHVAPHVVALGQIANHRLPPLMALADFFVQPGAPDAFNDYRFPSKLPEFFAIGRPVILPRTNLGKILHHGEDAWILPAADAAAIANAIRTLRNDLPLRATLTAGATRVATRFFNWHRSAAQLLAFYNSLPSAV